jgi:AraC-like DNA-binding protein
MSHLTRLFASRLVEVEDSVCTSGRSGRGAGSGGGPTHVALIRRGCFEYHLGSRTYFADSCMAIVYDEGAEYRTSHPAECGDDCTILKLDAELMAELFRARRRNEQVGYRMTPRAQVSHLATHALMKQGGADVLVREEAALNLLQMVSRQATVVTRSGAAGARQRRMVDRAKLFLNERLDDNIGLDEIAREAGCSAFHLMRLFRAETGHSLRGYRARLRVASAMEHLAQGADDLTQLALDLGFSSHSHLTGTFRTLLGVTPSELRRSLGREDVAEKQRFLEATLRAAA